VPAGEQPSFWTVLFEQRKRLLDALRALISKRRWDLQLSSSRLSSIRQLAGVMVALSNRVK